MPNVSPLGTAETLASDTALLVTSAATPSLQPATSLRVLQGDLFVDRAEIKRGGMGRIFTARDARLRRTVAIKELRADSAELRARFEREALLTARLEHPSIVGIHEAGRWASGEPFFAMRLVRGRSLDEVIEGAASFAQRLTLLPHVLAVADALAYAHHERVIHRDLKPQNVMVGEFGETVVIDWGLAKDLSESETPAPASQSGEPAAMATAYGEILGTPHYMPPEQAAGDPVDERADVYAIGAMLYHVLAGTPPYEGATASAVLAAVADGAPTPLADRQPDVPPDLLAVVERAMSREPAARYPSARDLADDLRRFQSGQLVGAHRYSRSQLVRRWLARHRTAVLVAAAATAVLIVLGTLSITRIMRERQSAITARELAERDRANSDELLHFMLYDLESKLEPLGRLDLMDVVARKARAYYEHQPPTPDVGELRKRGSARLQLGALLRAQGDTPAALSELRASLRIAEELAGAHPVDAGLVADVMMVHRKIGDVLLEQGKLDEVLASYRASLAYATWTLALAPRSANVQKQLAVSHGRLGDAFEARGDLAGALTEYRYYRDVMAVLVRADADPDYRRSLSIAHDAVARVLRAQGNLSGSRAESEASLAVTQALLARAPTDATLQRDLMVSRSTIGELLVLQGDHLAALASFREALALSETLARRDPTNADAQRDLGVAHLKIGEVTELQGGDAVASYRASLAIFEQLSAQDPANALAAQDVAVGHAALGRAFLKNRASAAALAEYRTSQEITEKLLEREPTSAELCAQRITYRIEIARARAATDPAGGLAEYQAVLPLAVAAAAAQPTDAAAQHSLQLIHNGIAGLMAAKDRVAALAAYQAAEAIGQALVRRDATHVEWQRALAITNAGLARLHRGR